MAKKRNKAVVRRRAAASKPRKRRKNTFAMKTKKLLMALPLGVVLFSLNSNTGGDAVITTAAKGELSRAGNGLVASASRLDTYKPALIATAGVGFFFAARRFLNSL